MKFLVFLIVKNGYPDLDFPSYLTWFVSKKNLHISGPRQFLKILLATFEVSILSMQKLMEICGVFKLAK